jgi:hypothetical protein
MRKPQRFGVGKSVGKALVLMDRKAHGNFRADVETLLAVKGGDG